jgi:S-adenosylmethionine decarboxylase proenzyme
MTVATKETSQASDQDHAPSPFKMRITVRFVLLCFASTTLLSFGLGWTCRHSLLRIASKDLPTATDAAPSVARQMPRLVLPKGKSMPNAVYTSKHFDTVLTTCDSALLTKASPPFPVDESCGQDDRTCQNLESNPPEATSTVHDNFEPVGQHLLVDIKNVDETFLNSEERLAHAMVTLVEESGTTMLSYHCHKLEPTGVSCVGVLLESHITFHTWPEAGVITLDMFTCGTVQMLPLLGMITRVCGVPETPMIKPPVARWALKYRGFPAETDDRKAEVSDLDRHVLGSTNVHVKEKVAEMQTEIQRVEIYDVLSPRSRGYGSDESLHKPPVLPDRIMYTDKVMQSRRYGEKEYHEALVHPAMIAHENPRRVAILGGGDGAALREVLKHGTVQRVTMIEIDRGVVELSRRHLPEWSSCGIVGGRSTSCFDDHRTELVYADAVAWFKDKFGAGAVAGDNDRFDVVIMDALYVLLRFVCSALIYFPQPLTDSF